MPSITNLIDYDQFCGVTPQPAATEISDWEITPLQLKQRFDNGDRVTVIDVREPHEYRGELGHIAGSVLIPLRELAARAQELVPDKNKQIITICRAGVRSTTAAAMLSALGFEQVSNLSGGMLDWNAQKLPVER